jgi:flagellar basal body-associated protein FliL
MINKKLLAISLVVVFILFIVFVSIFIKSQQNIREETTRLRRYQRDSPNGLERSITTIDDKIKDSWYLIPSFAFMGLFIGIIVFYLMFEKEQKKEKIVKVNTQKILELLSKEDKLVINKLLENNGKVRQYEITYIDGLSKLKVHRILRKLEDKGLIKKEKIGKVNSISLDEELYDILK